MQNIVWFFYICKHMNTLDIEYKLLNDDSTICHGTIDVEPWWTDYYIIDEFWNREGRYSINKLSIKIIRQEEHK